MHKIYQGVLYGEVSAGRIQKVVAIGNDQKSDNNEFSYHDAKDINDNRGA